MSYANNKGVDQPAHLRSLISAFVVHCSDSIISLDSIAEISRLYLASVAAQAGLCLAWSGTPEDTFCCVVAHFNTDFYTPKDPFIRSWPIKLDLKVTCNIFCYFGWKFHNGSFVLLYVCWRTYQVFNECSLKLYYKLFHWQVSTDDGYLETYDKTDEDHSNWMIFVRPARFVAEQNLVAYQEDGQIFFVSTKVNIKITANPC